MAIITPPAPLPLRRVQWRLRVPAQVNRSGWTGRRKVIDLPGAALWTAEGEFRTIVTEANAKAWRGFFFALRGPVNSFPLRVTETRQTPGSLTGAFVAPNGPYAGNTLPIEALPPSQTVLVAGDLISVLLMNGKTRLVCLTAPLVSNGSGVATAQFEPELGAPTASGNPVQLAWPFAEMALTSEPPGWDVDVGQLYSFTLSAEEAL